MSRDIMLANANYGANRFSGTAQWHCASGSYSAYLRKTQPTENFHKSTTEDELVLVPDVVDDDEDTLQVVVEGAEHKDKGQYLYFA